MAKDTQEIYRLSVRHNGKLYKGLSHSVEEDESLFVMNRNPARPRHLASGTPILTKDGVSLDRPTSIDERAHHVHYHPSGVVVVKARDGTILRRIQAPPMLMLSTPFLMFSMSVARIEQLSVDGRHAAFGDHVIEVSQLDIKRLQIDCFVGPKTSFDGSLLGTFGPLHRIVYSDAALYDVAYFAGEGAPIDPSIEIAGIKLRDTCLTGTQSCNIVEPSGLPSLTPEEWASAPAVGRQIRACLESCVPQFASRLGRTSGCYEIKISLCRDGVVAAVDWNSNAQTGQLSWLRFEGLVCDDVLRIVRQGPSNEENTADVFDLNPELCGGLRGTVFVRVRRPTKVDVHNALVLRGSELLAKRYWRVVPCALKRIERVIELIHSS